ncbi:MAG: LysM peptidoglycan-binding domain-containing protein [Chloroflexi bacterium]|uniref:DUF5666 domain-containing protein n=1 Tax=Candidatus Flexifilum breve TaxID=3140694 RepID=UPI0031364AAB|nr:LysM peptidoglycan-binding domain-containing protein [Chloroflexota bacterium]
MSKIFRIMVTVLIVALMAQGAFAQVTPPTPVLASNEFELVGVLESISQTSMIVAGFTIDISGAEVQRGLLPGDIVKVHASVGAAGLTAREVELAGADDGTGLDDNSNDNSVGNDNSVDDNSNDNSSLPIVPGEFELIGVLNSIQGSLWDVGGQLIDVSGAELKDVIAVGDVIKVHVSNASGQLVAREAELAGIGNAATCATTTPSGWRNYQIRGGDTLSAIAARAGITVEELARVNCINDIRLVVVGANLFVPRLGGFSDDNFNGNDNSSNDNGDDDNGNDNGSNDNGDDDNSNDNGSNDNGDDDNGNDNGDDHGGSGRGGDNDNGNDNGDDD